MAAKPTIPPLSRSCCDMCAVTPAARPPHWVIGEAHKAGLRRGSNHWRCWWVGKDGEWEGSAAGCCPGHTTCLPDVLCPAVAPGLGAGSLTLVWAQLECCWEHFVYMCVACMQKVSHTQDADCYPLWEPFPWTPPSHLVPQCLTHCPLWPSMSRPQQHTCTKTHTQNINMHRHKHTHGFNQIGMYGPL